MQAWQYTLKNVALIVSFEYAAVVVHFEKRISIRANAVAIVYF